MPKTSKVQNAEYVEPNADDTPSTDTESPAGAEVQSEETSAASTDPNVGWEVGKRAPSDKYIDKLTGQIVDEKPERSRGLIAQGEVVTTAVIEAIKLQEAADDNS